MTNEEIKIYKDLILEIESIKKIIDDLIIDKNEIFLIEYNNQKYNEKIPLFDELKIEIKLLLLDKLKERLNLLVRDFDRRTSI